MKYLDQNGLLYLWGKIKALIPTKTSQLTNDSGFLTSHQDITGKLDKTGDGKDVTSTFTQASTRTNIATGEKLSTMFGKIAKFFADMKTVAFTGAYSDLSGKPTKVSDFRNDSGFQTSAQVETAITGKGYQTESQVNTIVTGKGYQTANQVSSAINNAISGLPSAYTPKGSVAFASLPKLASASVGWTYNVTDTFTTTADFVEGAGKKYSGGTNVACVDVDGSKKWDVFSGLQDLSDYAKTSDLVAITNTEIDTITA